MSQGGEENPWGNGLTNEADWVAPTAWAKRIAMNPVFRVIYRDLFGEIDYASL